MSRRASKNGTRRRRNGGSKRSNRRQGVLSPLLLFAREHSLTLALLSILAAQLIAFWFQGFADWKSDQRATDQATRVWPNYVTHYMSEVWLSTLADTYGAVILVFLTKYFWERGSAESKD